MWLGGQAPGPDPKGHEMKLSAEVRADAKKYNSEYDLFEGYDHETGDSKFYDHYGVAYRYVSARVRRGEVWTIFGHRFVEDGTGNWDNGYDQMDELISC